MKKYFMTVATVALFAIGFAASDEENNESQQTEQKQTEQTEQKQETEAERQAREQKEEAERQAREQAEKENKKKEILEQAQKAGYEKGFTVGPSSYITDDPKIYAKSYYTSRYGAPTSSEEKELYEAFVSIYLEAYEEGHKAQQ